MIFVVVIVGLIILGVIMIGTEINPLQFIVDFFSGFGGFF